MEPKGFLIWVLHVHRIILGISNMLSIALTKIIQSIMFIEYLHEGISSLLGFVRVMQYLSKILEMCYRAQRIFNIL